jgi:hypothetical protein
MGESHRMTIEADNGEDILFACPIESCGRRLVLKRSGGLVVLNRGDFFALHSGGTESVGVSARVANP